MSFSFPPFRTSFPSYPMVQPTQPAPLPDFDDGSEIDDDADMDAENEDDEAQDQDEVA